MPGSAGSEGSPANHTPQDSATGTASPVERHLSLSVSVGARSIYDDPRATRFPSPPPTLDRSHSDIDAGHARTQRQRRPTDVGSSSSGPDSRKRTGTSTPTAAFHRGPDRSLRVNLMAACIQPQRRNRNSAGPAATGRLNAMAKGPKGQYVVGGSQCRCHIWRRADPRPACARDDEPPCGRHGIAQASHALRARARRRGHLRGRQPLAPIVEPEQGRQRRRLGMWE